MTNEEIIELAWQNDIEVQFAKSKAECSIEGIHLVEPTYKQIIDGMRDALAHNCKIIMIHSKLTWPYTSSGR